MWRDNKLLLGGGMILAALSGATAASALTDGRQGEAPADALAHVPGSERVGRSAPDPARRGMPWAVRLYEGRSGQSCLETGRTDGRRFGPIDAAGNIRDNPVNASGSCADLAADVVQLGVNRIPHTPASPARSVFFGRASRDVRSLVAEGVAGAGEVELDAERTFLIVLDRIVAPEALVLRATLVDGSQRTFRLGG
jgi:hypothetical protein